MTQPPVRFRGVTRSFRDGTTVRTILDGINLEIGEREMVALVGPSGCGKTTLLSIIGALDSAFAGEANVLGYALDDLSDDERADLRASRIGFVFQAFHLLDHLSALENVRVAQWLSRPSGSSARSEEDARSALDRVGLAGMGGSRVPSLSGGERQRVAIARAIVNRPELLLADEPTGNLDDRTGQEIFELFDGVRQEAGCAIVVATHDERLAGRADRVLQFAEGRLVPRSPARAP